MNASPPQTEEDVAKALAPHFANQKALLEREIVSTNFTLATVTLGISKGPEGHHTAGWISYWDTNLGKVHLQESYTTDSGGTFIAGGLLTGSLVLLPKYLDGSTATFSLTGSGTAGYVSIGDVDGRSLFTPTFGVPVTGSGTPWPWDWKLEGAYRFTHHPA